jgi:hypothetical protein
MHVISCLKVGKVQMLEKFEGSDDEEWKDLMNLLNL